MNLKTNCIGKCSLHPDNYCLGCNRTLDDIKNWGNYTQSERNKILKDSKFTKTRIINNYRYV